MPLDNASKTFSPCPSVVVGTEGELYFVGKGGYLLEYISGKEPIPEHLIESFWRNLDNRTQFCAKRGTSYGHVIVPDKQTVIPGRFPFPSCSPFAPTFLNRQTDPENVVLYPMTSLRKAHATNRIYPVHDSHLSGFGRLLCAQVLIESLDSPLERSACKALHQSLVTRPLTGNLAEMISRPDKADSTLFVKWPYIREYDNGKAIGRRGAIRVYRNPHPIRNQRWLLIGSSSLTILAPILACVYGEVVFCQSANVSSSLFDQVEPNVLVTGHVERRLLQIEPDNHDDPVSSRPLDNLNRCKWDTAFHGIEY